MNKLLVLAFALLIATTFSDANAARKKGAKKAKANHAKVYKAKKKASKQVETKKSATTETHEQAED